MLLGTYWVVNGISKDSATLSWEKHVLNKIVRTGSSISLRRVSSSSSRLDSILKKCPRFLPCFPSPPTPHTIIRLQDSTPNEWSAPSPSLLVTHHIFASSPCCSFSSRKASDTERSVQNGLWACVETSQLNKCVTLDFKRADSNVWIDSFISKTESLICQHATRLTIIGVSHTISSEGIQNCLYQCVRIGGLFFTLAKLHHSVVTNSPNPVWIILMVIMLARDQLVCPQRLLFISIMPPPTSS